MKLKDIALWTINADKMMINGCNRSKIDWIIHGQRYYLKSVSYHTDWLDTPMSFTIPLPKTSASIVLESHNDQEELREITLNLNNDILIDDNFVLVQHTNELYDENKLWNHTNYLISQNNIGKMCWYTIGLYDAQANMILDKLRVKLDYIINPSQPEPIIEPEKTLEDKIDELVDEFTSIARKKAIRKLKRILNERL